MGRFDERDVACPRRGRRYDLRSGAVVKVPWLRLDTHAVKIVGSSVMLGTTFAPRRRGG